MKNIFKVVFVIIGTIIGAGFATGQEIYLFFGRYSFLGIALIFLSSILFGIVIYKTLSISGKYDIDNYEDFVGTILKKKSSIATKSISLIVTMFLGVSYIIMCAGMGAYFFQEFKIPKMLGTSIMCIVAFIIFKMKTNGIIKINEATMPFLTCMILFLAFIDRNYSLEFMTINTNLVKWILNILVYVSYNSIALIPILVSLKKHTKSKTSKIAVAIICVITICFLSIAVLKVLASNYNIENTEIPVLIVAKKHSSSFAFLYGIGIAFAMLTSAISAGFGFATNISKKLKTQKILIIILSISAVMINNIGFSNLIKTLYPLFGILRNITNVFSFFILKKYAFIDKLYNANEKGELDGLLCI